MNGDALFRIGHGYDVHRFAKDRPLYLGGILVPGADGLLGHSDADVLLHAVMDAVLGALGMGDIGVLFPDDDARFCGIRSTELCKAVAQQLHRHGYRICNLDATVIAQAPKLGAYKEAMNPEIAQLFGAAPCRINIKATTEEGLGFTGRKEGISAHAVVLLERTEPQ